MCVKKRGGESMCMCVYVWGIVCAENRIFKPLPIPAPHPANCNLLGGVKLTAGSSDGDRRAGEQGLCASSALERMFSGADRHVTGRFRDQ